MLRNITTIGKQELILSDHYDIVEASCIEGQPVLTSALKLQVWNFVYIALSQVHRFHDNLLDMPIMDHDDYYWRSRVVLNDVRTGPQLKVIFNFFIHFIIILYL
jgi:hypothetical protein